MDQGPFDFSAMSELLSDPSVKEMAEKIAQDPAFAKMTEALQASLAPGPADGSASIPSLDPAQYQQAMSSILENSDFMKMAEGLGRKIMEVGWLPLLKPAAVLTCELLSCADKLRCPISA
jgi:hypothetical protein